MIKVITLDFWNTIVDTAHGETRRHQRSERFFSIVRQYNPELRISETDSAIDQSIAWFNKIWEEESRTVNSRDIINYINNNLNITPAINDLKLMQDIFEQGVINHPPALAEGIIDVLPVLSSTYQLGIISDTHFSPGSVLRRVLMNHGILQHFSAFSFSDEIGVSKPHSLMYQHIMTELDCEPHEMVHIGDLIRTDIRGASDLGIQSILYHGINSDDQNKAGATFYSDSWLKIPDLIQSLNES